MPLIDTPFKRVAVDIIGPIFPTSEKGFRYLLSMVDYATRCPDAVLLKNIDTETVVEALLDMYSSLGFPEEVFSDNGSQFISDYMEEVLRLLSIRQLTTNPYHPMCNGLVDKFNGTLKVLLKILCSEQPKKWPRYLNAVLFAYREVPQASTGFSPFELLYGRTARGPIQILKELWTKEVQEEDVKASYQYVVELRERLITLKIDKPGSISLVEHSIKLTSDVPVRSKPYSVPYGVRESLGSDIQEMQDLGLIRVSNSPYASPVVIVKKKDGSNRILS